MPTIAELLEQAVQHHGAGRLQQAGEIYRAVLVADPCQPDALHLLGVAAFQAGRPAQAVEWIDKAVLADPSRADYQHNLGMAQQALNNLDQAVARFRRAIELDATYVEAHNHLAIALRNQGRFMEAADCYRQLTQLLPDSAETYSNLGVVLRACGELDAAAAAHRRALELKPDFAEAHNNLANVLYEQQKWNEAESHYLQATQLKPDYVEALVNLANAYWEQGEFAGAVEFYDRTLEIAPDHVEAHLKRSMTNLLLGRFDAGWDEYEWRWKTMQLRRYDPRVFVEPLWDGSPLEGRKILLRAEQGFGDTLQFIRYAPLVKQRGGTVVVECQPELVPLLKSCAGIDFLVARGEVLPPFDVQAPLLSLPRIFGATLDTIPAGVPYLHADPDLSKKWERLSQPGRFRIGISWRGSQHNQRDWSRSLPLACFAPLASRPGVVLYSLQKGPGREELSAADFPVIDLANELHDFADTAAAMMHLDLVITCDSAPAHLAATLGRPIWLPLPAVPDWRWLLAREDSPWYPTLRLFRQKIAGDWPGVFNQIQMALDQVVA